MKNIFFIVALFCFGFNLAQGDTLATLTKTVTIDKDTISVLAKKHPISYEKDLGSVINTHSTVYIKTYGMGGVSTVSVRGGGANHTNVIWNGITMNSPTLGQADLSILPAEFYNTVTLNPGGYNTGINQTGIAGTVTLDNLISFQDRKSVIIKKQLGNFGLDRISVQLKASNGKWASETAVIRHNADNNFPYLDYSLPTPVQKKRTNASFSQKGLQQVLARKLKNGQFKWVRSYVSTYRLIPSAIGVASQNANQNDESVKNVLSLRLHSNKDKKVDLTHHLQVGYLRDNLVYDADALSNPSEMTTNVIDFQYNPAHYFPNQLTLKTQFIHRISLASSTGFVDPKSRNYTSAFLHLTKEVNRFHFGAQARQVYLDNQFLPFIYGISTTYKPLDAIRFFFSLNRNIHAPTLNDLYWKSGGNPSLVPEESKQLDVAVNWTPSSGFRSSAKAFLSEIDNWIQWLPGESGIWSPVNVKNVQKNGFEIDFGYLPTQSKSHIRPEFYVGYQYLDTRIKSSYLEGDQSVNNRPIYIPNHSLAISSSLIYKKLVIQYEQKLTSSVFLDAQNTTYLPYTAPANLKIAFDFGRRTEMATIWLNVFNIYNETYQTIAHQPLPGRYFELGLKLYFSKN